MGRTTVCVLTIGMLLLLGCNEESGTTPAIDFDGVNIYRANVVYPGQPLSEYHFFGVDTVQLADTPVVRYEDIVSYDTTGHVIGLRYLRDTLWFNRMGRIGDYGDAFVLCVDRERIYGGFFYKGSSSFSCPALVIKMDSALDSLDSNEVRVQLGYPTVDWFQAEDLRGDPRIIERLVQDGKAR